MDFFSSLNQKLCLLWGYTSGLDNFSGQQAGRKVFCVCLKQNKPNIACMADTELLLPLPCLRCRRPALSWNWWFPCVSFEESKIEHTYTQGITSFFQFPPLRSVGFSSGSLGLRKEFLRRTFKLFFQKSFRTTLSWWPKPSQVLLCKQCSCFPCCDCTSHWFSGYRYTEYL